MNPCECGWHGRPSGHCIDLICSPIHRHMICSHVLRTFTVLSRPMWRRWYWCHGLPHKQWKSAVFSGFSGIRPSVATGGYSFEISSEETYQRQYAVGLSSRFGCHEIELVIWMFCCRVVTVVWIIQGWGCDIDVGAENWDLWYEETRFLRDIHQFDRRTGGVPGRTVGRFGGSHPHWWEKQHGNLPGWDWNYYLICRNTNRKGHLAVLLDAFSRIVHIEQQGWKLAVIRFHDILTS